MNKNGRYEYLVRPGARGVGRLTRAAVALERGTLVLHFDLERYRGDARLPEQSILALVRTALFDRVLPFTIVEGRTRFRRDPQAPVAVVYAGRFADLQRAGAALE
jgi:hypothetical protein